MRIKSIIILTFLIIIFEFQLNKSGTDNLIGKLKDYPTGTTLATVKATHITYDGPACGFALQAPTSTYTYLDDFKVEKYE